MSIYLKMAWRNIWRNPRRTVLTLCAIAFACLLLVFMLSFQFGSYDAMINASVKIHTGHLQIQAKGYHENPDMNRVVPDPEVISAFLKKIPDIDAVTFRANAFSLVSSKERTYGVLVTGIDPLQEEKVSTLKQLIRTGKYFCDGDIDQALIGDLLARNLQVGIGDELTLLGQARDGSVAASVVTVKGIYSSGIDDFDRSVIQLPLKTFQPLYVMEGAVHEVVITVNSLGAVSPVKNAIRHSLKDSDQAASLVVLDWTELVPGLLQSIQLDLVSGFIMYLILIIVVAFSILNTFLMVIFERTREFGVMMAIGLTPGRLVRLILTESMMLTILGIFIGIAAGSLITLFFQTAGIDISGMSEILSTYGISGRIYPRLSMITALGGPVVVFVITFIVALYPVIKVKRLKPVEAMMHV